MIDTDTNTGNGQVIDLSNFPAAMRLNQYRDPAHGMQGMPPNFGKPIVPHIYTVQGRVGTFARVYRFSDEALRDSFENARAMRNHCGIMECLEARQRGTALLNWHLVPEDESSTDQEDLAKKMTDILQRIPEFLEFRRNLMEALWFGRYAVSWTWGWQRIKGKQRLCLNPGWKPVHGDKLVFRYDDGTFQHDPNQVGIRVGAGYAQRTKRQFQGMNHSQIEPTERGLGYFLLPNERMQIAVHKHIIEDGEWEDPLRAGAIHGVGIRDRIYWTWFQSQELLAFAMEYLERSAFGLDIWPYQQGNPESESATRTAAEERIGGGRSIILVPVQPGEDAGLYMPHHIEPGLGGVDAIREFLHSYFGHQIKRYILGQVLTSEAESTGLGSGVADAHLMTYADIVQYDKTKLEETLTAELVRPIQLYNFPSSRDVHVRLVIDTQTPEMKEVLDGMRTAFDMGLELKSEDIYDLVGASKPDDEDETLQNPQFAQMKMQEEAQAGGGGDTSMFGPMGPAVQDFLGGGEGGEEGMPPEGPEGGGGMPPEGPPTAPPGPEQFAKRGDVETVEIDPEDGKAKYTEGEASGYTGPHKGPRGGTFWISRATGQKVYGERPPEGKAPSYGEGEVNYGGETMTRAAAIAEMKKAGGTDKQIQAWLMGQEGKSTPPEPAVAEGGEIETNRYDGNKPIMVGNQPLRTGDKLIFHDRKTGEDHEFEVGGAWGVLAGSQNEPTAHITPSGLHSLAGVRLPNEINLGEVRRLEPDFELSSKPVRPKPKPAEFESGGGRQQSFLSEGGRHKDMPGQQTMFDVDALPGQVERERDEPESINDRWQETATGRSVYKADIAKENAKDQYVHSKLTSAPSFSKLLAAAKRATMASQGKHSSYGQQVIAELEQQPWQALTAHAGVMNAKSASAKTLATLTDAVFSETGLPRKPLGKFRGEDNLDWDAIEVEGEQEPPPPRQKSLFRRAGTVYRVTDLGAGIQIDDYKAPGRRQDSPGQGTLFDTGSKWSGPHRGTRGGMYWVHKDTGAKRYDDPATGTPRGAKVSGKHKGQGVSQEQQGKLDLGGLPTPEPEAHFDEFLDDAWNRGANAKGDEAPAQAEVEEMIGRELSRPEWEQWEDEYRIGVQEGQRMSGDMPAEEQSNEQTDRDNERRDPGGDEVRSNPEAEGSAIDVPVGEEDEGGGNGPQGEDRDEADSGRVLGETGAGGDSGGKADEEVQTAVPAEEVAEGVTGPEPEITDEASADEWLEWTKREAKRREAGAGERVRQGLINRLDREYQAGNIDWDTYKRAIEKNATDEERAERLKPQPTHDDWVPEDDAGDEESGEMTMEEDEPAEDLTTTDPRELAKRGAAGDEEARNELRRRAAAAKERGVKRKFPPEEPGPTPPVEPTQPRKTIEQVIQDFGEEIPGARKHTAKPLGSRGVKEKDARPGWERRYDVGQIAKSTKEGEEGKWAVWDTRKKHWSGQPTQMGGMFNSEEEAKAALPLLEMGRGYGVLNLGTRDEPNYSIYRKLGKKIPVIKDGFASRDEAMKHMAGNAQELIDHKFPNYESYQYLDSVQRTGGKPREASVTPKDFQETFGFRGGQFGNWQANRTGQDSLDHAYDALNDLADATGLPPRALSLNGDLALAFGARGTGGKDAARAHYEPGQRVVNLTKMAGAGTLAHEWAHSMDDYFGKQATGDSGKKGSYMSGRDYRSGPSQGRMPVTSAFKDLVEVMHRKKIERDIDPAEQEERARRHWNEVGDKVKDIENSLQSQLQRTYGRKPKPFTPEQKKEWDSLKAKVAAGDIGKPAFVKTRSRFGGYDTFANVHRMNELYKGATGHQFHTTNHQSPGTYLMWSIKAAQKADEKLKAGGEGETETRHQTSDFYKSARDLDRTKAGSYYTNDTEMLARAFEGYIYDKMQQQNRRSDYLVGKADNKFYRGFEVMPGVPMSPFPEGDERTAINSAFDKLFQSIKHEDRTDEKGQHVRMHAKTGEVAETPPVRDD